MKANLHNIVYLVQIGPKREMRCMIGTRTWIRNVIELLEVSKTCHYICLTESLCAICVLMTWYDNDD